MPVGPYPSVHSGGTTPRALFDQYLAAAEAVRLALEAVTQASPHPRDYVRRDDDYASAVAAHAVREVLLTRVKNEMFSLASDAALQLSIKAPRA